MIVGIACGTWDSHSARMTVKNDQKKHGIPVTV